MLLILLYIENSFHPGNIPEYWIHQIRRRKGWFSILLSLRLGSVWKGVPGVGTCIFGVQPRFQIFHCGTYLRETREIDDQGMSNKLEIQVITLI